MGTLSDISNTLKGGRKSKSKTKTRKPKTKSASPKTKTTVASSAPTSSAPISTSQKDNLKLDVLLSILMVFVSVYLFYFIFYQYFEYLRAINCECAINDWKFDFLRVFFIVTIIYHVFDPFIILLRLECQPLVRVLRGMYHLFAMTAIVVLFAYLQQLSATNCECSEHRDKNLLKFFNTLQIVLIAVILIIGVISTR